MKLQHVAAFLASVCGSSAKSAEAWKSRSIYQVVTDRYGLTNASTTAWCDPGFGLYCGGTWQGIINHLDYIHNMGFDAIWISPITHQLTERTHSLNAYHGYWQQDLNSLNSNFGDKASLQALSKALHDRGMYLMVDVVVNHMGWAGNYSSVQYDKLLPFNDSSYYHSYCDITAKDANQKECWLGDRYISLPDFRTEDSAVRSILQDWIKNLVSTYSIDGLRIDSTGNTEPDFFPSFVKAAGVFVTGEIYSTGAEHVCPYQKVMDSVLNFPVYFPLVRAFKDSSGSISNLVEQMESMKVSCRDTSLVTTFCENHDLPRFANYTSDISQVKNVLTFNMLSDGIPITYYGMEQHLTGGENPLQREALWLTSYNTSAPLYKFIGALNVFRKHVISGDPTYLSYQNYVIHGDDHTLAIRKGHDSRQVITVLSNLGEKSKDAELSLPSQTTGFIKDLVVTEILGCTNTTTDSEGSLSITIKKGLPSVFFPANQLLDSGICGNGDAAKPVKLDPEQPTTTVDGSSPGTDTEAAPAASSSQSAASQEGSASTSIMILGLVILGAF